MSHTSGGYITEIEYTSEYYDHLNPHLLAYTVALNGYAPIDTERPFRFLELGSGQGLTLNLLAAANPDSQFIGVDMNPSHVKNSNEFAKSLGLENARSIEAGFDKIPELGLGEFDIIACHGVYTWVSSQVQADIRSILKNYLRAGGIAMVSYNSLPGWSAIAPLRQMMLAYLQDREGDPLSKAKEALSYLKFMCDNQAGVFESNLAKASLKMLEQTSFSYLIHEYFNEYWRPLYFSEFIKDMEQAGVSFAGSLPLILNYGDLSTPPQFHQLLATSPTRHVFETHKDFVRNEQFRRDVFVKTAAPPSTFDPAWLAPMYFGLIGPASGVDLMPTVSGMPLKLNARTMAPLIQVLGQGSKRLEELVADPLLSDVGADELRARLQLLMVANQCTRYTKQTTVPNIPVAARLTIPNPINLKTLQERAFRGNICPLVSPALGAAIILPPDVSMVLLLIAGEGQSNDANLCDILNQRIGQAGLSVNIDNRPAATDWERRQVLEGVITRTRGLIGALASIDVVAVEPPG